MLAQGRSTLSSDDDGCILDRLVGLEKVIPAELVRQVLLKTKRVNGRACKLTHEVIMWIVLAQGLLTHLPIRQVFRHARRLKKGEKCPARSSLCEGRRRLGSAPLRELHAAVVRPLATADTPGCFYRGWRLVGIDGTVMDVPDSVANADFGRASGGRGEGAFPQVRKVSLVELGTHVEIALAIGGWHDDERTLARTLWNQLPADSLLLEDRGFYCYDDWEALNTRTKMLCRVQGHMVLTPLKQLPDGSYLAKVYPASYYRKHDKKGIVVRVIEYTLNDPQRTGHKETHRLITNLLDPHEAPAKELILLYHERWEVELVFDEQKTHQDPRRAEKPAQFRSETPEGVRQEIYAVSLAHFLTRSMMLEAACSAKIDVDRLSFTGSFRILQCRLPECDHRSLRAINDWYQATLAELCSEQIGPRRNRINPRVIKRKMSKWNKKRPEHRRLPPLLKTFEQSILIKT